LPVWLAVTVQDPLPLVIVIVALPVPLPLHTPEAAIDTASPDVAVAAALKLLS
jgi:hypothetical protein